jgi:hypothetical protein
MTVHIMVLDTERFKLIVFMLSVANAGFCKYVQLSVVMLSVIMLYVVVPWQEQNTLAY